MTTDRTRRLRDLDRRHVWHPFTPMRQWRAGDPLVIDRAEGFELIDTDGHRYIDGVSSLWCNVHGHRAPEIDGALRAQLDRVGHTTLLGLASPPSIELAARLCAIAPGRLSKVFYSDAGATAVEVALKMAVGYWFHRGRPEKKKFLALGGAYHGDTTGAMSVGFSDLFHRPFASMVFEVAWFHGLEELERLLTDQVAAVVLEPVVQGAAGMVCQPPGFVKGVAELARKHDALFIADEVATGFGRTGKMFACEHDGVSPDILCLGKGLSGGYLPLAATLATDDIDEAFCGELSERRTLFHGHTYTGNALACAAALASLELFEKNRVLENARRNAELIHEKLAALRSHQNVADIRQRGLMVGIEMRRVSAGDLCLRMRGRGLILRPLGDVIVLMPAPAMDARTLTRMLDIVVETIVSSSA